jgi:hypothetical protein
VVGGWRRQHTEKVHNLHTSPNIIREIKSRRMRWMHITFMGEMRNAYNILIGKSEGKRPFARPRCRWEGNIRIDIVEIEWEVVDWMHLAQERDHWWVLVNIVMNLQVP